MGTYLNPGNGKFRKALDSEIYVDKTEMITYLNTVVNTEQCCVSVSRPRRPERSGEYADIVYLPSPKYPDKPALLVELKYDKTVQTAADQIRDRKYPQKLEHYEGNLLLVSVNYDKELAVGDENYKRHSCRIEKY